jgi:hypothetical protein
MSCLPGLTISPRLTLLDPLPAGTGVGGGRLEIASSRAAGSVAQLSRVLHRPLQCTYRSPVCCSTTRAGRTGFATTCGPRSLQMPDSEALSQFHVTIVRNWAEPKFRMCFEFAGMDGSRSWGN